MVTYARTKMVLLKKVFGSMGFVLAAALIAGVLVMLAYAAKVNAATYAVEVQIDVLASEGENSNVNIFYGIVDSTALKSEARVASNVVLPTANPGLWKDIMIQAVIDDAALGGYTLTPANVRWLMLEPGDYRYPQKPATWTKDITKTNIPAAYANVYIGNAGEGQLVDFSTFKQYRLVIAVNKIGTGTHDSGLMDVTNVANVVAISDAAAAGEKTLDSGWTDLPAWASGEKILKPVARDSLATGDPVYHQFALYLR